MVVTTTSKDAVPHSILFTIAENRQGSAITSRDHNLTIVISVRAVPDVVGIDSAVFDVWETNEKWISA